jgi:hypothetical protein
VVQYKNSKGVRASSPLQKKFKKVEKKT